MLDNQLASAGYGRFTQQQLVDAGVLENVTGYEPPIHGVITTLFGGSTPFQAFHTGLDIAGPDGTPVHAAAGGLVIYAGLAVPGQPTMSYGNCVVIMHNAHTVTIYGHMQLGLHDLQVRVGEVVSQGQVIGFEGATGWATGPHVHFEMRINNVAFDPLLLLNVTEVTAP
jgi:murein DD-endopeptidase MepM/ murein hydrolase activator NlpD